MIDQSGRDIRLEVDGGIDVRTTPLVTEAGANVLVAGSAIFGATEPAVAAWEIRQSAVSAASG